jgi:hypothetical protein
VISGSQQFITADAEGIPGTEYRRDRVGGVMDDAVAVDMPVSVICNLQVIDVEYSQRKIRRAVLDLFFKPLLEPQVCGGVADIGEGVGYSPLLGII